MANTYSRYQQDIIKRYYDHRDTIHSNKLTDLVSELWLADNTTTKKKLWSKVQSALTQTGVNNTIISEICRSQDVEELAKLVAKVDAGDVQQSTSATTRTSQSPTATDAAYGIPTITDSRTIKEMREQMASDGGFDSLEEYNLKRALKKFRKKLKALRRDDESKLGNRYVTSGRQSTISAITPPHEYPAPVWEKLAQLGRLKHAGQGTYELPDLV